MALVTDTFVMLPASDFLRFWGLSFLTLCVALVLLSLFYRVIDSNLGLHGPGKELVVAVLASLVEGTGIWFARSIVPGGGLRSLIVPAIIVSFLYYLAHLEKDWSGYETGGILAFQAVIWSISFFMLTGEMNSAGVIFAIFVAALAIIGGIAKSAQQGGIG
jgi:hypothetical protein